MARQSRTTPSGALAPDGTSGALAPGNMSSATGGAAPSNTEEPSFDHARLPAFAHYDRLPLAFIPFSWVLPWFYRYIYRVQRALLRDPPSAEPVDVRLWSFNVQAAADGEDCTIPFFPGYFVDHTLPPTPHKDVTAPAGLLKERYADGHLGPGDPFEHTQYFRLDVPYAGFVLRPTEALRANHPAYRRALDPEILVRSPGPSSCSVTAVFIVALQSINNSLHSDMSQLSSTVGDLWPALADSQPTFPADADIRQLVKPAPFAAYLDHITHVQRGLRAKLAWTEAARRLCDDQGLTPVDELRKRGPPMADMKFMGVWVNTTPEDIGLWLLIRGRVPIYVAERVKDLKDPIPSSQLLLHAMPSRSVEAEVADRALRSRSSYLPVRCPVEPPDSINSYLTHAGCLGWRPTPQMERHVVDVEGFPHGWIQVPPIPNAKTSRNWDVWAESSYFVGDTKLPCFVKTSRERAAAMVDDAFRLYDEEDTRLYFIEGRPEYSGLVDSDTFGMPIPRYRHFYPSHPDDMDLAHFSCRPAGRWGYVEANIAQQHGGRVQVRPANPFAASASRLTGLRSRATNSTSSSAPSAARGYTVSSAPSAAASASSAPVPMEVDSPTRPPSPPVTDEAALRAFTSWQLEFSPYRFSHEPRPRSRLQPQQRGRFAYHVRISPEHEISWARVLRALSTTPAYRTYEFDFAFRAIEGQQSVYSFTLPDERLAQSFVAALNRHGLALTRVDARMLSTTEQASLAALGLHNDRWERPPLNRQPWSRASDQWTSPARRGRSSPPRWSGRRPWGHGTWRPSLPPDRRSRSPRRRSPSPRRRVVSPRRRSPSLHRRSPTPRWRSPSPARRPSRSSGRRRSPPSPPRRSPSPRWRSPTPRRRAPLSRSASRPPRTPPGPAPSARSQTLSRRSSRSGSYSRSRSGTRRSSRSSRRSRSGSFISYRSTPPRRSASRASRSRSPVGTSAWGASRASPADVPSAASASSPPPPAPSSSRPSTLAADPASAGPSRSGPSAATSSTAPPELAAWPLAQSPSPFQRAVFCSILSSWPTADPLAVAQAALSARPLDDDGADAPMDVDSPLPLSTPGAGPSTARASLQSRLSDAPAGGVGADRTPTPPPSGPRSLLDRVERPPLSTRISEGVPVPDLEDRLTDEGEIPHGRQRGGRRVRERFARAKQREGRFDPRFPDGFPGGRRTPSLGSGGAGRV